MPVVAGTDTPLYDHRRLGFRLAVFENRVEAERKRFMFLFGTDRTYIATKTITGVDNTWDGKVVIRTTDGRKRTFFVGLDAPAARDAILRTL